MTQMTQAVCEFDREWDIFNIYRTPLAILGENPRISNVDVPIHPVISSCRDPRRAASRSKFLRSGALVWRAGAVVSSLRAVLGRDLLRVHAACRWNLDIQPSGRLDMAAFPVKGMSFSPQELSFWCGSSFWSNSDHLNMIIFPWKTINFARSVAARRLPSS